MPGEVHPEGNRENALKWAVPSPKVQGIPKATAYLAISDDAYVSPSKGYRKMEAGLLLWWFGSYRVARW